MPEIITLEEAQRRLGENVVVCLEPDDVRGAKIGGGKAAELWCFDPATGRSGRGDGKFHDARYVDRGGWGQIALYEEPNVPPPEDGSPRVVGHVVIEMNRYGAPRVRVRRTKGLNGEVLELRPSSISKGELADKGKLVGNFYDSNFFESNPQRIAGVIAVYLRERRLPGCGGHDPGRVPEAVHRRSVARGSGQGRAVVRLQEARYGEKAQAQKEAQ
ncbi:hypothetical protein HZB93_00350 [Candidatus Falkowbacteria bacterium]|nr:hypothetical protein [Candidatus Falkowbacteria bacterium]